MTNDELIIACTLDPTLVRERVAEWRTLVERASTVEQRVDGVRLTFRRESAVSAGHIADLAEAERDCCPFFSFTLLAEDGGGTSLDVTAPPSARTLVDVLLSLGTVVS